MKYWFLLSVCLIAFAEGRTCFAQQATTQKPITTQDQRDPHAICPTVSVSCPADPGLKELDFTATVAGGDPNVSPTYHWEVADGEIIAGQGTPAIRVKRQPCEPATTATLRIGGFDTICSRTASCSTSTCHRLPPPNKFDSYGLIPFDLVRVKLEHFAAALKKQPGAMGYIRFSQKNKTGDAQKASDDAKQYLVEKFDIQKDRIRIEDGGTQEEFMIELWLVPLGSYLPEAAPKLNPPKC